jgi:predicted aldo/keto reductase-like oxidoreductase
MQYRNFGRLDWKASALGFGCMRLPALDGKPNSPNIDETQAIGMIRHAIDSGVNYIDTAYPYHAGQSEVLVGKALLDGYREKVKVATKMPPWMVNGPEDFDRILNEQLGKLQTDHVDFYLLHALSLDRWRDVVLKHGLLARAEAALADGRIRHLGFSFHDSFESFPEILNGSDLWSFCQIQYNYMDTENQAGTRGLKLAAEKGLAVVIMEPLMGGRLVDPPQDIRKSMESSAVQRTPADWALQWLWDQPEVSVVLSGMSNMPQVEENLRSAENSRIHSFTATDQAVIEQARQIYQARIKIPCSACSYCMPCPNGVNIPANFYWFNFASLYDDLTDARVRLKLFVPPEQQASACIECGVCEDKCPQKIPISDWMPKVAEQLT